MPEKSSSEKLRSAFINCQELSTRLIHRVMLAIGQMPCFKSETKIGATAFMRERRRSLVRLKDLECKIQRNEKDFEHEISMAGNHHELGTCRCPSFDEMRIELK